MSPPYQGVTRCGPHPQHPLATPLSLAYLGVVENGLGPSFASVDDGDVVGCQVGEALGHHFPLDQGRLDTSHNRHLDTSHNRHLDTSITMLVNGAKFNRINTLGTAENKLIKRKPLFEPIGC